MGFGKLPSSSLNTVFSFRPAIFPNPPIFVDHVLKPFCCNRF